ncbi:uncharacterized protein LOC127847864 isoform X2 [Dreissena polymorpha]|uniref:uncharacterized protein LOC127847864 isoform X2 n=1 Tax=Dreissena polymorpha TaxID=45954 RepID=UPI00226553A6|nr:uncharacterized protein LOC127847864 isoform X2 [Dreissena polymorpha]
MASKNSSPRSDSPADIDFSVIRTSIQMDHPMIDQILQGIHYGSAEARSLLQDECDYILECKVCRNMFRSFPNFVAHKRVYCTETFAERRQAEALNSSPENSETIVVQPEAPSSSFSASQGTSTISSTLTQVVNNTFQGKSKAYQLYTKAAEIMERQRATKVTTTVALTTIPTNKNAVIVSQSEGDQSEEILRNYHEKQKADRERARELQLSRKAKSSISGVCAYLAQQKPTETAPAVAQVVVSSKRLENRARKSSPRKSVDYLTESLKETSSNTVKAVRTIQPENDEDLREWIDVGSKAASEKNKTKVSPEKSPEKLKTNTDVSKPVVARERDKSSGKFLPYSTGYKKCDRCAKVFWKAKSYSRHYSSCKKSLQKKAEVISKPQPMDDSHSNTSITPDNSKTRIFTNASVSVSQQISPVKTISRKPGRSYDGRGPEMIVVGPKGEILMRTPNTELIKLQEKLRAKAIWTSTSQEIKPSNKLPEKEPLHKGCVENPEPQPETNLTPSEKSSNLYKALTKPATRLMKVVNVRRSEMHKEAQNASEIQGPAPTSQDTDEESSNNHGNNLEEIRKLQEKLTRQAGLKESGKPSPDCEERRTYSLRTGTQTKVTDFYAQGSESKAKESKPIQQFTEMKQGGQKNSSQELLALEEKLTNKIRNASGDAEVKSLEDNKVKDKHARSKSFEISGNIGLMEKKRHGSEKLVSMQTASQSSELRSSSSQSDSESRKSAVSTCYRAPKKLSSLHAMVQKSLEQRRHSLPTSPTPSIQSNSGDGLNKKCMMTVKEMAELVECASLTKFAKERKKRARNFLTKKQSKDALSVTASFSKRHMKRRQKQKQTFVVRNQTDTRNQHQEVLSGEISYAQKTTSDTNTKVQCLSKEMKGLQNSAGFVEDKYYKSKAGTKERETHQKPNTSVILSSKRSETLSKDKTPESRDSGSSNVQHLDENASSSRDSSKERNKELWQMREMKRLENSVGFVGPRFYGSSRDSSRERLGDSGLDKSAKLPREMKLLQNSDGFVAKNTSQLLLKETENSTDGIVEVTRQSRDRKRQELNPSVNNRVRSSSNSSCESLTRSKKVACDKETSYAENVKGNLVKSSSSVERKESINQDKSSTKENEKKNADKVVDINPNYSNKGTESDTVSCSVRDQSDKSASQHRTRLSTGSIFFDSELLKLSPSKLEKKIASVSQKEKLLKETNQQTATVVKKLNLSPRKTKVVKETIHQYGFYPLSTGLKQCPNCHQRFWKKKTYDYHVRRECKLREKVNTAKKRKLSLTPPSKARESVNNTDTLQINQSQKKARIQMPCSSDIRDLVNTMYADRNKQTEKNAIIQEHEEDKSDEILEQVATWEIPDTMEPASTIGQDANDTVSEFKTECDTEQVVADVSILATNELISEIKSEFDSGQQTADASQDDSNISNEPGDLPIFPREPKTEPKVSSMDEVESQRVEKSPIANRSPKISSGRKSQNFINTQSDTDNCVQTCAKSVPDNVSYASSDPPLPGSSGLQSAVEDVVCMDESEDAASDFSGFSEEDLQKTEAELSIHLEAERRVDVEPDPVDLLEDDLSDLGDIDLSGDLGSENEDEVKGQSRPTLSGDVEEGARPKRISAEKRSNVGIQWTETESTIHKASPVERICS